MEDAIIINGPMLPKLQLLVGMLNILIPTDLVSSNEQFNIMCDRVDTSHDRVLFIRVHVSQLDMFVTEDDYIDPAYQDTEVDIYLEDLSDMLTLQYRIMKHIMLWQGKGL